MTPQELLNDVLRSREPARALRDLVRQLSRQGRTTEEIYNLLENVLVLYRTSSGFESSTEDVILDVMDAMTGWCHPSAHLPSGDDPVEQSPEG